MVGDCVVDGRSGMTSDRIEQTDLRIVSDVSLKRLTGLALGVLQTCALGHEMEVAIGSVRVCVEGGCA